MSAEDTTAKDAELAQAKGIVADKDAGLAQTKHVAMDNTAEPETPQTEVTTADNVAEVVAEPAAPAELEDMAEATAPAESEAPAVASASTTNLSSKPNPKRGVKISLAARIYGVLMILGGLSSLAVVGLGTVAFAAIIALAYSDPELHGASTTLINGIVSERTSLSLILIAAQILISLVNAVLSIRVGNSLLRSRRRKVVLRVRVLIGFEIASLLIDIMLNGISEQLGYYVFELAILVALSVRIDPSLRAERRLERKIDELENAQDVSHGMEGRDRSGKGYLDLNFFNLFWEFVICSVLGLILEIIWHMIVVDPGNYQDRAGLIYGPFSPIYGYGAVLITLALNRLYKKNVGVVFAVSALVGGAFEAWVSFFMQVAFGAVAWDYSDYKIFGIPDPVAVLMGGRTSTFFLVIWGILGLVWIKAFLPVLLKVVNLIPWKLRYGLTTLCAALMILNTGMTMMSLDCWYERVNGKEPVTPVEQFFAANYDNDWMSGRFESMTITPSDSARVNKDAIVQK